MEQGNNKIIGRTELDGGIMVSTVFLGLDHGYSFNDGAPVLFETMIFGGEHHDYQERYCTWDEAVAGHARAIALVFEVSTLTEEEKKEKEKEVERWKTWHAERNARKAKNNNKTDNGQAQQTGE